MVTVLRQQLIRVTIGNQLVFTSGDGLLRSVSVRISEQDRGSQCTLEIFDPHLRLGNLLLTQFQAQGGILTPDGLLQEIQRNKIVAPGENATGKGADIKDGEKPTGDDLARLIIQECPKYKVTQKEQIAYILGTVQHESSMGIYLRELKPRSGYSGGLKFAGKGYVQLTHDYNYKKMGKILGVDLFGNPELAAQPKYAIPILIIGMRDGIFTGKKLDHYINSSKVSFRDARRIVNGMDRASLIAGYARTWLGRLNSLGYSSSATASPSTPSTGREVLASLSQNQTQVSTAGTSSVTTINLSQGTTIKIELGFNDKKATSFTYFVTGIRTTNPSSTTITGKQLRFLLGQSGKISAVTQNVNLKQLARKIENTTGIKVTVPNGGKVQNLVQTQQSDYQGLLKLAQKSGLFVRGDDKEIKIEPLKIGDKTYTVGRKTLMDGSYWRDEASSSRVLKGSIKTTTNLGADGGSEILGELSSLSPQVSSANGIVAINSTLDSGKGIGKGFPGQITIDSYRLPQILNAQPGQLVKFSPDLGFGAALARSYRIGEITHTIGRTTLDIYLPVAIKIPQNNPVTGSQPGIGGGKPGVGLSLKGEFKTPLAKGDKIAGFTVTSPYGFRIHPITGSRKLHGGVDIGAPTGTPLYAICKPGTSITLRRSFQRGGGGNMAIFEFDGYKFYYLHCSQVAANGVYKYGQIIARVGNTGSSTAPHLHFTQKELDPTETVEPFRGYVFVALTGKFPS